MSNSQGPSSLNLLKPVSVKIVQRKETKIGDQTETSVRFEAVGANGVKGICDQLTRSLSSEKRTNLITATRIRIFASENESEAAESWVTTTFTDITKGEREGDSHLAAVETTVVSEAGIHKFGPRQIKMPLKSQDSVLPDDKMAEEVFNRVMEMKF